LRSSAVVWYIQSIPKTSKPSSCYSLNHPREARATAIAGFIEIQYPELKVFSTADELNSRNFFWGLEVKKLGQIPYTVVSQSSTRALCSLVPARPAWNLKWIL
jgi:hypothetical protein